MKTNIKNKYLISSLLLICLIGVGVIVKSKLGDSKIDITHIEAQYIDDFTNNEVLMGASHNVFVGKVIKKLSTKDLGLGPETQYEVEIIDNIKGKLDKNIIVNQIGGYINNELYVVGDENEKDYLLKPDYTYLFATRYNSDQNWYTLNSHPNAIEVISRNSNDDKIKLKNLIEDNKKVKDFKSAYINEKLLDTDVRNKKALNSYESTKKDETVSKDKEAEKID